MSDSNTCDFCSHRDEEVFEFQERYWCHNCYEHMREAERDAEASTLQEEQALDDFERFRDREMGGEVQMDDTGGYRS